LFFVVLPADSPYYLSPHLGPPLSGHFFFDLVHQMSARGGARGGAFPSAHVSGAVVVTLVAWRHQRRLAYLLLPIIGGVMMATVYGRFHYALDTLAGAVLAVAVVMGYRYLSGGPGQNSQLATLRSACCCELNALQARAPTRRRLLPRPSTSLLERDSAPCVERSLREFSRAVRAALNM
jgi:membrane-associated phospholipid phosphatase